MVVSKGTFVKSDSTSNDAILPVKLLFDYKISTKSEEDLTV